MVANLTAGKKGYEAVDEEMKNVAVKAQILKDAFLKAVDDDSKAFDDVMAAMRMPKKTDEEKRLRVQTIEEATKGAVEVPMTVVNLCLEALELIETVAARGNENSLSDAGVSALAMRAAAAGAALNVLINLPGLSDADYVEKTRRDTTERVARVSECCTAIYEDVLRRLEQ
jgi:glutamate formiminotransferase/formiminotetrahydrofolate cyclodeaminase